MAVKSGNLQRCYKKWQETAAPEQIAFVDDVFDMCEKNYENGGSMIVECYEPEKILKRFTSLQDVRGFIGLNVEQALNARSGEDDDPQLETYRRFNDEWK